MGLIKRILWILSNPPFPVPWQKQKPWPFPSGRKP
jgi:hypothetical protein